MSTYSTGTLAKLVGVSVRTLQYYDKRGLLQPSTVTEGGRRQYSPADADRLQLILFLKGMGLSLTAIQQILVSNHGPQTLALLLEQQEAQLNAEQAATTTKLTQIATLRRQLPVPTSRPLTSKTDMDALMEEKQHLRRVHGRLLIYGIIIDVIEVAALVYGFLQGNWWPFASVFVLALIGGVLVARLYLHTVNYVCPNCQTVFKPSDWSAFWAPHNAKARRLTCPHCHQRNFCVEVYDQTRKP